MSRWQPGAAPAHPRKNAGKPDAAARGSRRGDAGAFQFPTIHPTGKSAADLNLAISHDDGLKSRDISFIVANGDVSVTGTVRTEEERRKINELAMNIGGVKSVAKRSD